MNEGRSKGSGPRIRSGTEAAAMFLITIDKKKILHTNISNQISAPLLSGFFRFSQQKSALVTFLHYRSGSLSFIHLGKTKI